MRSRSGFAECIFFIFFGVFSFVVCIGSFLIQLSFIRFNVVVVIGHDDIEMWTKSFTMRATRPSDWNLKRLSQRTSIKREKNSDFIRNFRTLNVSVL